VSKQAKRSTPTKVLLVDGYNVLRAGQLYRPFTQRMPDHSSDAFNAAREALLSDVVGFAGREYAATVVFDGAGNPGSTGEARRFGTIEYRFSPAGVSADTVIEQLASEAAHAAREVLVISSDATVQWTVFGRQVTRMSAAGFCDEVLALRKGLEELATPGLPGAGTPAIKNTLAERLDPLTRKKLEKLVKTPRE
jgi:predicted RNA-binding protein with PIN domain